MGREAVQPRVAQSDAGTHPVGALTRPTTYCSAATISSGRETGCSTSWTYGQRGGVTADPADQRKRNSRIVPPNETLGIYRASYFAGDVL